MIGMTLVYSYDTHVSLPRKAASVKGRYFNTIESQMHTFEKISAQKSLRAKRLDNIFALVEIYGICTDYRS